MTLRASACQRLASFALLGPGFTGRGWTLLAPLALDPGGVDLAFLPFEARAPRRYRALGREEGALLLDAPPAELVPALEEAGHAAGVRAIRQAIAAGDVYQVNLTLRARLPAAPGASLLAALCARGLPRFAAWVRLPEGGEFASGSPELFLESDGARVASEPMKGTAGPGEAERLLASEKDGAELAMITDLVRNDLAPVCRPRSVRVAAARRLVDVGYAVQTVSRVEGELLPGLGPLDALLALHPGGSVTGAPKRAALDAIRRLEPTPRGAYCGALLHGRGAGAVASLLIRTAERSASGWTYGVGGGITWGSDPDRELAEARLKLEALCATPRSG